MFDTHLHLIDRSRLTYPWLTDAPALNRDWTYADYETAARRLGVTDALHMEVDVATSDIEAETAFVADLMARPNSLIRGAISAARPETADFPGWLDRADRNVIKGIRRVLHVVPDGVSQTSTFRDNLRRMGHAGLPFDICLLARQLPLAAELADAAPDTTLILDHCGVPDIAGGGFEIWAEYITNLARRPNLNAKISGITAYTGGTWTLDTLRPYTDHILNSFGWTRVVWGSDSPVCTLASSLPEWIAATRALFADASANERAALFHQNARRLWQIA